MTQVTTHVLIIIFTPDHHLWYCFMKEKTRHQGVPFSGEAGNTRKNGHGELGNSDSLIGCRLDGLARTARLHLVT